MTTDSPPQDTGRGARRRRAVERGGASAAPPAGQPKLPFAPLDLVSRDELESIHQAALEVLKEIGIDFLHDEARAMLSEAGADVDPASRRVRFDPALVEAHIGLAPKEFTLHARNPARNLAIGGRHVAFGSVASAPNSFDRAGGRRPGNKRDFQNFIRLGQSFDSIHFWGGYPVEPIDIHASVRHLDALFDMLTLSDKPIHAYSLGRERNLDAIEMVKIARGIDDETLEREPSLFTVINSSSPLRLDTPMLEGDHPDGAAQSGGRADAVHARRRHGPGHACRRARRAACGGARRPRHDPGRAARRAVRLRRLHLERRHEIGRAGVRHARIHENGDRRRAARAPPWSALSLVERQRRQFARRPGGL